MQFVLEDLFESAPPAMTHRDMDDMFDDYLNYLIQDEARSTIVPSEWNAADDYIQCADPFLLQQLIEESTREAANRRRQGGNRHTPAGQRGPGHETSPPGRQQIRSIQQLQGLQQVQNVDHVPPEGHVQNGDDEQIRTHNGPERAQNVNETDPRDGHAASSFTHTSERRRARHGEEEELLNVPEDADPITVRLLKEIQLTNSLLRIQDDRIHELERQRRRRSPPRKHYRSRSYSSSRSPPRRYRRRSPSSSRSPPRRYRRRRTRSRSPPRKSKKNQRPEATEARSPSPEQDHRGPSKAAPKPGERPPRDNRTSSDDNQGKPRRNRHYTSPGPSDEEDFRSPLSGTARPPPKTNGPSTWTALRAPQGVEPALSWRMKRGSSSKYP
ncbi:uncharacterized protein LOC131628007 [Vicia villosa]|uniref:uncharacterized protein LOC131628007 n=1 Tax=Vicia villosa TaxID=3911 RepID=UPI00273BEE66|nr:uncharacterized protein LOC131628007 [Vicia villosa]